MRRRIIPDIIEEGRDLRTLPATATARDAARTMHDWNIGAVLVMQDGQLIGIFTERDLVNRVVACDRDPRATHLQEVMTKDPDSISPEATAMEALRMMEDGGYRHLPVVLGSRVVGILSRRDLSGSEKAHLDTEKDFWERL